jgi:transposase
MLSPPVGPKVFLAAEPVDMRRGHDGLCALVSGRFRLDPYCGQIFVFVGKRGDRIKAIYWDRGGFVLYYKRLARGRFQVPRPCAGHDHIILDATELAMLLGGFDLKTRRQIAWEPRKARVA